ncbi:CRIB domain-containing protein RIC4 [Nicotiana tabacum]|uniref:CRIB domain-containing protein RIC4 n=1 Tax=Nicotiana tabacum TaxID=4097 RepID=A0A1S4BGY4_TOBAC|nr:CRIB domain-containing protein RIC4-like [Nicotiana tomentosiformis]XP_016488116.1 PREDICTED: CRIB domain-containing protein RIC4-like [Nicotiana tabacum]
MRYRMERFVLLPFSVGCISESSVAVGHHHQLNKSPSPEPKLTLPRSQKEGKEEEQDQEDEDDKGLEGENLKSTLGLMALPKFQRLFKNLSQLFVDKEEMEDEEEEMGMEIGLPTDVKHVTHIGIDGDSTSSLSTRNWDHLKSPNDNFLTHFPSNFPLSPFAIAHSPHSPNHISMASSSY